MNEIDYRVKGRNIVVTACEYIRFLIYIILDGSENKNNYIYYEYKNRKDESNKMPE